MGGGHRAKEDNASRTEARLVPPYLPPPSKKKNRAVSGEDNLCTLGALRDGEYAKVD